MKVKLNKFFYWSILFQVLATQGVLSFIIFKFLGNWEIKKLLHPISFFLVVMVFIVQSSKKIKITILDILFFGYFLILLVVMFININNLESAYIVFREVYFVFILIFIFSQVEIRQEQWDKVLNLIFYLLIFNSVFILLTNYLGPEKYMKMITGRYQWGIDPEFKFKISNFYKFWRSPALIGDAASVGYFSVIGYLLMDQNKKFKNKKYIALFPLIFSFVRSAYLVFFIYEFLNFFTKKKNLKILVLILKIGIPLLLILGFVLSKYDILSLESLQHRFYLWENNTEIEYNSFFGGAIGNVGGGARGQGFISTIDSYWLFMLFSSGIIGVSLTILFIYEKSLKTNKFLFILLSFLFAGFFVSLTQSLVFLALFPLLFIRLKKQISTT
jgi:hypothetical protein